MVEAGPVTPRVVREGWSEQANPPETCRTALEKISKLGGECPDHSPKPTEAGLGLTEGLLEPKDWDH